MNKNFKFKQQLERVVEQKTVYLDLLNPEKFVEVHKLLFDESLSSYQRQNNYRSLKPFVERLEETFKNIIVGRNKLAQIQGYSNYLEFYLAKSGIPEQKYKFFLENIDRFSSIVYSDSPARELFKKVKGLKKFDFPYPTHPYGYLRFIDGLNGPDDIIGRISLYSSKVSEYGSKVKIARGHDEFFSETSYVPKEGIAEIKLSDTAINSQDRSLTFVHEYGHALDMLEHVSKNKNPKKRTDYLLEYQADKFVFKFIKTQLSDNVRKVVRYNLLRKIAFALFEIDIYTNDRQNFDSAFARALGRCYLKVRQSKNPFHVFNKRIVGLPFDDLIHSINYVEFYLKDVEGKEK